jgi:hypothetical protein
MVPFTAFRVTPMTPIRFPPQRPRTTTSTSFTASFPSQKGV